VSCAEDVKRQTSYPETLLRSFVGPAFAYVLFILGGDANQADFHRKIGPVDTGKIAGTTTYYVVQLTAKIAF
jgi:hypothetical protein